MDIRNEPAAPPPATWRAWQGPCVAAIGFVSALLSGGERALADCQPTIPFSGAIVSCTGTQNITYTASNLGTLTVNADGANFNANPALVAMNIGSLTITSTNSNLQSVSLTDIANLLFTINGGNMNGGITLTGGGIAELIVRANINGLVSFSGAQNTVDNFGTFNQGLVLSGTTGNSVTNRSGAFINQIFSLTSPFGHNMVSNAGTINNGLTLNGNGTSFVENLPGATINQGVTSTGASSDVFLMLGGTVNGEIKQGAGDDKAEVQAGTITGFVRSEAGKDVFLWTGGFIGGLDMGTEDDVATFRGLTPANLKSGLRIDGGLGFDRLKWENTVGDQVDRFFNWELFELTNNSQLIFDNSRKLVLGNSGTGTGTLSINSTSTVLAGNGAHAIMPFTPGLLVTVMNAGTIDLTNGPAQATDSLTIQGNYIGVNGRLLLHTVLAGDGAPSDKLVIGAGTATGTTSLFVTNVGGAGALTTGNGILVVDAINSATTAPGAFVLGAPVVAGPYEYLLFRGSKDASAPESWFLRSALDCSLPGAPSPPCAGRGLDLGRTWADLDLDLGRDQHRGLTGADAAADTARPCGAELPPGGVALCGAAGAGPALRPHADGYPARARRRAGAPAGSHRYGQPDSTLNGAWGRVIAQHGNRDGDRVGIFGDGPKYDFDFACHPGRPRRLPPAMGERLPHPRGPLWRPRRRPRRRHPLQRPRRRPDFLRRLHARAATGPSSVLPAGTSTASYRAPGTT